MQSLKKHPILILTWFFTTIFVSFTLPNIASAAPYTANDPAQTEYIQWRAYRAIRDNCLVHGNGIQINKSGTQAIIDEIFETGTLGINVEARPGMVFNNLVGNGRTDYDCNTQSHIEVLLGVLGFSDIGEFVKMLNEKIGKNTVSRDDITSALDAHMRETEGILTTGHLNALSPAALYWYWNTVYRTPASDGGCGGIIQNQYQSAHPNRVTTISNGPFYIAEIVNGKVEVTDRRYASYNKETQLGMNGLDARQTINGTQTPTCQQIIKHGVTKARADAYAKLINDTSREKGVSIESILADTLNNSAADSAPSCESHGGSMSWLICSALGLMDEVVRVLDGALISVLMVPNEFTNDDGLKQAWSRLRNIAYIILVPIVLVMVIGTALSFDFISAYTVKRAMPRLVIAAIFIALSFDIAKFLVELTNGVGVGIYGLITSSFTGSEGPITLQSIFAPAEGQGAVGLGLVAAVGVGALAVGSIGIIFSYMLVMLVGLAMGFFLLSLRQVLIVALMILAPLAILSWVFPGNDKLWKLWWNTFTKLLMLFPLVMIVVAAGRSFAYLTHDIATPGGWERMTWTLMKLVAYVGPFFFIPALFKFAGGAFATLAGITNDKSRGLFDRQRKYRGQKMGETWQATKGGNRFRGGNENNLRGRFNRGLQGAAIVGTGGAGLNPLKMRRELARSRSSAARTEQQELIQNNEAIKTAMVDDDIARAVLRGGNEQQIRDYLQGTGRFNDPKELNDAVSLARRAQAAGSDTAVKSAMAVGLAGSKTGFETHDEMFGAVIEAAGGDTALERALLADVKKASEGARPDLAAPGYTSSWNALQRVKGAMGTTQEESVKGRVNTAMRREALQQVGAHAMLAGKSSQTVQTEMTQLGNDFDAAMAAGDVEQATELASQITAYRSAMGSASPEARRHVMAMLDHVGYDESYVDERGLPRSASEQLGEIINFHMTSRGIDAPDTKYLSQAIHTRAGGYDTGGYASRVPEEERGGFPPKYGMP